MVGRGRELSRRLAGSAEDTFIKRWEEWGDPPSPGSGRVYNQAIGNRALLSLREPSPQLLGCCSLAPLASLGSSFLTFVFPFGLFLSLQIGVVNSSLEKDSCVLGMEH